MPKVKPSSTKTPDNNKGPETSKPPDPPKGNLYKDPFAGGKHRHEHIASALAPHSTRVTKDEALGDGNLDDAARSRIVNNSEWWGSVFLAEETDVRVSWNVHFDAAATCSRQNGAATEDFFLGRLRFTGELFLKKGLREPQTMNHVLHTEDGYEIAHHRAIPCHYEGDLNVKDFSMSGGWGAFYIGLESREVYSGPFGTSCTTDADDASRSGAKKGSTLGSLYTMYRMQHNMWLRSWQPIDGLSSNVEVRRAHGGDESMCYEYKEKQLWSGDRPLPSLSGKVGDRGFILPPGVVDWVVGVNRTVVPWLGALRGRPASVIKAVKVVEEDGELTDQPVQLVRHSDWVSAEAIYQFGEALHFRKDDHFGRNRVLKLAYGPQDYADTRLDACDKGINSMGHYPWDKYMDFHKVFAIVYNPVVFNRDPVEAGCPIGVPYYGNHAEVLVFFEDLESTSLEMKYVFRGRPVAVPVGWASKRFPDQYAHALNCPNMPVLVEPCRLRFPELSPRTVGLLDMELLVQLHKEDISTAVERYVAPQTPSSSGTLVATKSSVSVLWGLLQRHLIYGFMPVTRQLLALGLGDLGNLHEGGQLAVLEDVLWQDDATLDVARPLEEPILSTAEMPKPKRFDINRRGGKNNPHTPVADGPVSLVVTRQKCIMNLHELMYVPNNGRTPFVANFDVASSSRAKHVDETRPGYTLADYTSQYAVSLSWVLQYFHPLVPQMAVRGVWDGKRFLKAVKGGDATLTDESSPSFIRGTAPESWPHLTLKNIHGAGSSPTGTLAGCAKGAFAALLRTFEVVDSGALDSVRAWSPWVEWTDIGQLTSDLCKQSSLDRVYRVRKFQGHGKVRGSHAPRNVLNLLSSPLGRRSLFEAGLRRIVFRPVYASGWQQHMVAVVANDAGDWTLLDPDDGGLTVVSTNLHGSLPGIDKVLMAFALCVNARAAPKAVICEGANKELAGPPLKRQKQVAVPGLQGSKSKKAKKTFQFPIAPTVAEARADYFNFHLRAAVDQCLRQKGLARIPSTVPSGHVVYPALNHHVPSSQATAVAWMRLVDMCDLTPLDKNKMQLSRISVDDHYQIQPKLSMWGPVRGGGDHMVTFYAVEGVTRVSVAGSKAVFMVVVTATRHAYYCPRRCKLDNLTTPSRMGFVGPVTEYFIDHWDGFA